MYIPKNVMMKENTFHTPIFHTSPFAHPATGFWDTSTGAVTDVLLTNDLAREHGISKMKLSLAKVSAINAEGSEQPLEDFPAYVELHPKGMGTEFYVSLTKTLSLEAGTYTAFRFYLASGDNHFIFADGREEALHSLKHIDFQIRNGLEFSGDTQREVRLRFDFAPMAIRRFFRPLLQRIGKSKATPGRLAQSFGN